MPVHNSEVTDILRRIADLLEIEGANEFRVRAYREAAQSVENLNRNISEVVDENSDLTEIPGIGESVAEKIKEIVKTGSLVQFEKMKESTPEELADLLRIEGLGPKKVRELHEKLDVNSAEDLREVIKKEKVRELKGFSSKTEKKIEKNLGLALVENRTKLIHAEEFAEELVDFLNELDGVEKIEVAGSYRRRKDTVGDLDIVASCSDPEAVMNHFVKFGSTAEVVSKGNTKTTIRLRNNLKADLRVVDQKSFGAALLYFTGSRAHTIALRKRALDHEMKLNEYGIFRADDNGKYIAGSTEEDVYKTLRLSFIPPEIRENRGELEAARNRNLPELVTIDDIRGDLHMHTTATDGKASIREMANTARQLGYDYIAITDHSKRVTVANGLDEKRLRNHMEEIDEENANFNDLEILKGIEVDILDDGSLDLKDDVLKDLDIVIASVHYKYKMPEQKQTDRYLKALDNPQVNIIAHPTGRVLDKRDGMKINLDAIMKRAKENGCHMEINATPDRMDLDDINSKKAKEIGLKLSIATDAHSTGEMQKLKYGIYQARRGWLEKQDVINTYPLNELRKLLKR